MATEIIPVPQKLTCEDIQKSAEFLRLSKRMRVFALAYIQHYITTGEWDAVRAAREAYTHKNMEVLRVAACRVRKHPKMLEVLDLFMRNTKTAAELAQEALQRKLRDLEREIRDIERHLAAADAGSTAGQRLISTRREVRHEMDALAEQIAKGVQVAPKPEPAPHRYNVGDIFTQDGVQYQTTSVDADGQPLTADEVK
jgi:alkanesulfonate monooxygenase SsuD/methylene tetrahydromethanopterin reductase-like flavin-dependent oxidoreductase (luciferase family)